MKLGLIGGSGLYELSDLREQRSERVATNWGAPSAPVQRGWLGTTECLFVPRHGRDHALPPHRVNYRANVAALHQLGAELIIATAATGGIGPATGAIVVPDQLIDYTWGREHTFSDGSDPQPRHVDFTEPFTPRVRKLLLRAAAAAGVAVTDGGVYGVTQGPRLETAAEIDRLARDGCTLVGMTAMPEAALARELGCDYANLSLVVNAAAGRAVGPITMADIERELERGMRQIRRIIEQFARDAAP